MSTVLDLLKGKKIMVHIDELKMDVEMEILSVEADHQSRDLEAATAANDWWPKSESWTNYIVRFTTGGRKTYRSLSEIKIL